jgi:glutathione S-transferase
VAAPAITVWGSGTSRALRVLWALHELGLDYEHQPIGPRTGETLTDDYGHLNAKRKIPTLVDGDRVLTESGAIVNYLFAAYGADANVFVPANPFEQAVSDEWCYFALMELDGHCLYVIRRHDGLSAGVLPEADQRGHAAHLCRRPLPVRRPLRRRRHYIDDHAHHGHDLRRDPAGRVPSLRGPQQGPPGLCHGNGGKRDLRFNPRAVAPPRVPPHNGASVRIRRQTQWKKKITKASSSSAGQARNA